ncbi:MAG: AdeC/AdeK/OprM family multidrug efflux complex outer membrane factor [Thermodesulfobacteriota bacterium]
MRAILLGLLAASLLLAGCQGLAPDYQRPPLAAPSAWPQNAAGSPAAAELDAAELGWREFFADARLRRLIELALAGNRDLRVAALNIERARAQYQIQRADELPTLNAGGGANIQRLPAGLSTTGGDVVARQYTVTLGFAAYELDLFGRVKSLKDQALEQYLASQEARRSAQISLVAEVAYAYLTLAADKERLRLAQDTLASQRASYELTRRSFEVGVTSALDLRQAQTSVEAARVDVADYTSQTAQDVNALALLIGAPVPDDLVPEGLSGPLTALPELPAGLPSAVLQRRPDILQAEHLLKAANANIGAARARFYPSISLTALGGTGSHELYDLFKSGSGYWSFAPSVTIPIFNHGRNQANLEVAEADREMQLARYDKAVQTAFREVADALALRATLDEKLAAQRALVEATTESYRLSDIRFRKGVASYLAVLVLERGSYTAQQALINVRHSRQANLVALYKALGGGWKDGGAGAERAAAPGSSGGEARP